jgi:pimeloyl-ACP methyl ester carboxylesterase
MSTTGRLTRALRPVWSRRWIGIGIAVAVAGIFGVILGLTMPRGPMTTPQALIAMLSSLLVGGIAGVVLRSRWAMLLAPAVFMVVYELVRVGTDGPTVDAINLSIIYGVIAFVVGRGFTGLLTVLPMLVGAVYGAALARRIDRSTVAPSTGQSSHRIWRGTRRVAAAVTALAVIALAVLIARPAGTDPILAADGNPDPAAVAELTQVQIGGHDQTIMIRGANVDAPVLLYLAGGPGGTDIGAMRLFGSALEQDFVVATWDQRGAGKSYPALDPTSTLTVEQSVRDTIEVTDYLRHRFDEQKIYLVGQSWGSIAGVLAVQQRPDLFHAYIGVGQRVDPKATDQMFYADTVAYAERTGNTALTAELATIGPPPYANMLGYVPGVLTGEPLWNDHPGQSHATEMPANLYVREYSLVDQVHSMGAFFDTFAVLYPQLQNIDFRVDVPALQVPVYLVQGRYEARGRAVLADEWFTHLQAPNKQLIVFDHSGHRALFEEPARFHDVMTNTVLPLTDPK